MIIYSPEMINAQKAELSNFALRFEDHFIEKYLTVKSR